MSSFAPGHFGEYPPPLGEGPSHPERPQDPGQTNLVIGEILRVSINDSMPDPLDDTPQALGEESSHPEHRQDPGETHLSGMQQVIITAIHATDLTLGLRRIPAGFHVVLKTEGAEFQTSNKPVHVDQAVVEWNELILLPCEPSSIVRVGVYASFELGPMLCHGEVLRTFEISVGELLDRSEKSHPIIFQPKQEEVVSSCTSLVVTVERRSDENGAAVLCPLTTLMSDDIRALLLRTDAGHGLLARYRRMQNHRDLEQSINHFEHALDICPMNHPCRPAALFNLATAKFVNCQANGTHADLDIPVSLFQDALDLRPTGHLDRPITQLHLAISLLSRFVKRGFQTDPDTAEELLSEILDVCSANSHIYRAALLAIETSALHPTGSIDANDLGQEQPAASMHPFSLDQLAYLVEWCSRIDDPHALDEVISLHYDALGYYNTGHACRGRLLGNLSVLLHTRFQRRGNDEDLDQAITLQREALALHPVGHTARSKSFLNLAVILSARFNHRSHIEDLDEAVALGREALALRPVSHTDRPLSLNNLAGQLYTRFRHQGNDQDLAEAIALQREALALCPVGHTYRPMSLYNLAIQLSARFNHRGHAEDLDEALVLQREGLALCPVGHIGRSKLLDSLGNRLSIHFDHRGNAEDLDEAIALHREALALRPVGNTDRSTSLNNLANRLSTRFDDRRHAEDLDEAIALHREALALRPVGHAGRSESFDNLANQLSVRFHDRGNAEDLDEAMALQREALALCPVGHTDRSKSLNNLANRLFSRFHDQGYAEDLDEAIALRREVLALRPIGHTDRSKSLNNLALSLSTRFQHRGNREDLDESRENLCCALTLLMQHDPFQLTVHDSLATVYLLFHQSGLHTFGPGEDTDSLNAVMHHLKAAANVVSGSLLHRLETSLLWVRHASQYSHGTELEAYATSMQLLDTYMSATASVSSRHDTMKAFPSTLAVDAASYALRSDDVYRAVELLEQGRTVIWTQMTRLRTPLDSLQTRGDHAMALVKRFRDISSLLDKGPASHAKRTSRLDVEAEEVRYRRLVEDWNKVVEEIRKIEDFSRFLLPPLFSDLQDAARDGPIIVLIASKSSCDAIIIPHKQPPTSIPLPTSLEKLQILVDKLQRTGNSALMKALMELWDDVVCPVVKNLGKFAQRGSRIWWCPTSVFNFLPLHAAGEYRPNGESLSGHYISSYTPSLTALMRARRSHSKSPSVSFAAIGQKRPAGASFTLNGVEPELDLVLSLLPPPPAASSTKVTSVDATKSGALSALRNNTWLHFACHGTQKYDEPFNSAFLMRDQPLSLLDITQMDLSRHQFAFLSACETAVGDIQTPDEVIHLAAGLQFAGVKSVVGTLWEVNDGTVQHLVKAFYKNLCGDGTMNSKRAARALYRAVQSLARDKEIPLDQRIVFMHIGI
ncbi:CHAT domain-containing protein [Suillus placidus]|uniref:CHAT domain-containing protein n=1 Tax=Suillus placidus TaxID=48579 RepID=A0A9P7A6H3_9AGAM|nr:CHAT domain-containing protein [Suillus placidus]